MNNLLTQSFEIVKINPQGDRENRDSSVRPSTDLGMDTFFQQVLNIEAQIDKMVKQLQKLQSSNEASRHTTKASEMKAIKLQMESDIDEVGRIALKAKKFVEELDRDNLANRRKPGCEMGTGVDRSRHAMTMALKKKLKDRLGDFQTLKKEIHDEYRETVQRRFFTDFFVEDHFVEKSRSWIEGMLYFSKVTGTQPDEQTVEKLIETGDGEQIFAKAIQGQGRGQFVDTLAEMQERRETVLEIERKLQDLQQMFLDLSILVDAQGDMLNDIEAQVSKAVDHVQSANVALQAARKTQSNSRKYMFLATLLFTIVVILVLIPTLKGLWRPAA